MNNLPKVVMQLCLGGNFTLSLLRIVNLYMNKPHIDQFMPSKARASANYNKLWLC